MKLIDSLKAEFEHEAQVTRKHLERLPADQLGWRPHAKSYSVIDLGSHIVECVQLADPIFGQDEFNIDPATYRPYRAPSVTELLKTFDEQVANCRRLMAGLDDAALIQSWSFKIGGRLWFEKPRAAVFRDFTLSHLIHHRGQFSVYLRLLDVPVPGSYGPTADEQG